MYRYAKMVSLCGVMVLSSMLYAIEPSLNDIQWGRSETEVMLSLLHLDALRSKASLHNASCYHVCESIRNNEIGNITERDVRDMVTWMVQLLENYCRAKKPSRSDEEQRLYGATTKFLVDCMACSAYRNATKQNYGPCFSQLVADSLEACNVHVLGDATIDGQIINPCCQGSEVGGPTGPAGPIGPVGPIGPRGTCSLLADYLFAAYFSTGFVGTDGNFIVDSSSYLELPANQEVVMPLEINPSMTSGWDSSTGSSSAFVVPETGLYEISYQISVVQPFSGGYSYSSQVITAWIERIDGTEGSQLAGSSASYFASHLDTNANFVPLNHTFLAVLNANEEITLVCSNKGFVFGTSIGTQSLIIVSGASSSIASSLVITRVA